MATKRHKETQKAEPKPVRFVLIAHQDDNRRFWDALHFFADGQNDFGRQPIVSCSTPIRPSPFRSPLDAMIEITVNPRLPGAETLLKTVAMAAGAFLRPI